jgi:hypothetical protein
MGGMGCFFARLAPKLAHARTGCMCEPTTAFTATNFISMIASSNQLL